MPDRSRTILYLLPLTILLAVCVYRSVSVPFSDYAGYYFGGRALLQGHYQGAYDIRQLNVSIAAEGYKDVLVSYAPFPPFSALVFAPFLLFKMGVSKILFNCCSCALFLFTLYRVVRFFSVPPYFLLLAPVVFFIPIVNNIYFGQSYLLLTCLLLEGFMAYKKDRMLLSSALWGVAILFKLFPAVLLLWLLLRKKYRSFLYLSAACGLLFALSLLLNGVAVWKYYLWQVLPKLNSGELNDSFTYIFQSAHMLLKRVFLYDALLNPHPVFYNPYLFVLTMAVFKALLITGGVLVTGRRKKEDFLSFAVWLMVSMLISPNGSSYSLVLLVIPLMALAVDKARILALAAVILFAACSISVQRFGAYPVWAQFPRLYLLLIFFVLLMWAGLRSDVGTARRWKAPAVLTLILSVLFYTLDISKWLPAKDNSSYLLTKEEHLFIYDYTVRDKRLVYYSWDGRGQHETVTDYRVDTVAEGGVEIRNNQIWYRGKEMTMSPDQKEKPLLLNGAYIVYLSDLHRGVGFYTLRKIRL